MSKNSSASGGIGFLGALTILFIGLKLIGKIDWSWWWVLCPMWIIPGFLAGIGIVIGVGYLVVRGVQKTGWYISDLKKKSKSKVKVKDPQNEDILDAEMKGKSDTWKS